MHKSPFQGLFQPLRRPARGAPRQPSRGGERPRGRPDFNIFNLLQLFGRLHSEMQVMLFRGRVTFFKMHLLPRKMQVVLFRKALLAFFLQKGRFPPETAPQNPLIRGRPPWPTPLLRQRYEIFSPKANSVKRAGGTALTAIIAVTAIQTVKIIRAVKAITAAPPPKAYRSSSAPRPARADPLRLIRTRAP